MDSNLKLIDQKRRQKIDWSKNEGLIPAVVQDNQTRYVLMLGYMNEDSLKKTEELKKVCFWSRSRKRLWIKGESSKNFLFVEKILIDCDEDTLLILAQPTGPVCHLGYPTCFGKMENKDSFLFLRELEKILLRRYQERPSSSYTSSLFNKGLKKCAEKLGEEAVEVIIAALREGRKEILEESADLLFHLMVLLRAKELSLEEVIIESLMLRKN